MGRGPHAGDVCGERVTGASTISNGSAAHRPVLNLNETRKASFRWSSHADDKDCSSQPAELRAIAAVRR